MPLLDTDILWRASQLVSDSTPAQNGGRMATRQILSDVKNNLFPDVSQSERTAGSVTWRKAFIHVASAQDTALLNARVFLESFTPAGDFVTLHPGTATDTQDQITGRAYGIATLAYAAPSGDTHLILVGEAPQDYAVLQPFRIGDVLRFYDATGVGQEVFVTVSDALYDNGEITVTLASPLTTALPATTLASSVITQASVAATASNIVVTSAAGQLDTVSSGQFTVHNKGAIEENWSLLFTSATEFVAAGLSVGVLAAPGSTTADYAPLNPTTGTPYFTIRASAWSGAFAANDTVLFQTSPAVLPIWYRRCVPPGTASLANDYAAVVLQGESA